MARKAPPPVSTSTPQDFEAAVQAEIRRRIAAGEYLAVDERTKALAEEYRVVPRMRR
jgi:hypothetical protein